MKKSIFAGSLLLTSCAMFSSQHPSNRPELKPFSRVENAAVIERAVQTFDPSLHDYLLQIDLYQSDCKNKKHPRIVAYASVPHNYIEFCRKSTEAFTDTALVVHEYLHFVQKKKKIDVKRLYGKVRVWYADPHYGESLFDTQRKKNAPINWTKTSLDSWLYKPSTGGKQYREEYFGAEPGVEEFAYIGVELSGVLTPYLAKKHAEGLSPAILKFYNGVFYKKTQ